MKRELTSLTIAILLGTVLAGCYSRYDRDPYYDGDYRSRSTYRDSPTTDRPVQQGIREGVREGVRDTITP